MSIFQDLWYPNHNMFTKFIFLQPWTSASHYMNVQVSQEKNDNHVFQHHSTPLKKTVLPVSCKCDETILKMATLNHRLVAVIRHEQYICSITVFRTFRLEHTSRSPLEGKHVISHWSKQDFRWALVFLWSNKQCVGSKPYVRCVAYAIVHTPQSSWPSIFKF